MQNFRTLGLIIKKVRDLFNLPDKYGKIIQCDESDSEPEETKQIVQNVGKKKEFFSQNLPNVVKKNIARTPQLKAQASKLTFESKKKLIEAKITDLSKTKQEEQVRLTDMLEKKPTEKRAMKRLQTEAEKENIQRSNSLSEDEEAALRESLLNDMKKREKFQNIQSQGLLDFPGMRSRPNILQRKGHMNQGPEAEIT